MKVFLKNTDKMFSLEVDDFEKYVLKTMCGGVGMFEVRIMLDSEEVDRFHREGNTFIEDLAYDVSRNTRKYSDRLLK